MATPRRARVEATSERAVVTPLELFFDLVFVFALTQVTDLMAEDPTVGQVFRGVLMLGVLWWSWTGYAWLGNIARADEGIIRVAMFAAMGAVFVAAITIPEAFDDGPGRPARAHGLRPLLPRRSDWCTSSCSGSSAGRTASSAGSCCGGSRRWWSATALLLVAAQTSGTTQTLLWLAALVVDLSGAFLAGNSWRLASASHFAERHGLIILIALGESIVATGIGIAKVPISLPIIAAVLLGLAISGALWWAYFDVTALLTEHALAAARGVQQIRLARGGYSMLHLPMIIGVVLLSLGLKKAIGYVAGVDEHTLADPLYGVPMAALFGGTALYLLAHVWFKYFMTAKLSVLRIIVAALLVALAPVLALVPALVSLAVLAVVVMVMVGIETHRYREMRHALRHGEHQH